MDDNIKQQVQSIDEQIAELYDKRMALVKNNGIKGLENKATVNRVTKLVDKDIALYCKQLFNTISDTANAYNYRNNVIGEKSVVRQIQGALNGGEKEFPVRASVACQGVEGAYSSIAAEKLFAISDIMYFKNFENVFYAVEKGLCEYGILPIENSAVGTVNAVYDLMKEHKFFIVKRVKLRIQHSLLAPKGVKKEDIKEVFSHDQAINQCSKFLKELGDIKITTVANTAVAAQLVATSGRKDAACLSSPECAELYDLSSLANNVQDSSNNFTRFICISKQLQIFDKADKISLMMTLPNVVGSLTKVINKFSALSLNLTKLQSRPQTNTDFEFLFYFDFDADIKSGDVQNLIADLEGGSDQFVFLGSYSDIV